jgi:hypothetical protein
VHLPIPVLKRRIAQSCRLYGSGIQQRQQLFKTRALELFWKIDKLLIEPRINIRQQVSKQFALKLEGNLKIKPHSNHRF